MVGVISLRQRQHLRAAGLCSRVMSRTPPSFLWSWRRCGLTAPPLLMQLRDKSQHRRTRVTTTKVKAMMATTMMPQDWLVAPSIFLPFATHPLGRARAVHPPCRTLI